MYNDWNLDKQMEKLYKRMEECIEDHKLDLAAEYAALVKELEWIKKIRGWYLSTPTIYYTYPQVINPCPPQPPWIQPQPPWPQQPTHICDTVADATAKGFGPE
jgi:hypothetical protein